MLHNGTFINVPGRLTGSSAAVRAAFLVGGAVGVALATLHTCGSKSTGSIWSRTRPLLHRFHREEKLTAHHTLGLFIWENSLEMGKPENHGVERIRARTLSISITL